MDHDKERTRTERPFSASGTRRGRRNGFRRDLEECERLARVYTQIDVSENRTDGLSSEPKVGEKGSRAKRRGLRAIVIKRRMQGALANPTVKFTDRSRDVLKQVSLSSQEAIPVEAIRAHPLHAALNRAESELVQLEHRLVFGPDVTIDLPLNKGSCKFCGVTRLTGWKTHQCTGPSRARMDKLYNQARSEGRLPPKVVANPPTRTHGVPKGVEVPKGGIDARRARGPGSNPGIKKFPINLGAPCRFCGFVRIAEGRAENTAPCPSGGHPKTGKHQFN